MRLVSQEYYNTPERLLSETVGITLIAFHLLQASFGATHFCCESLIFFKASLALWFAGSRLSAFS
jgi:hypothetical protein